MGSTVLKATTTPDEDPQPQLLMFSMQFTSSPRGARLARRLAVKRMDQWGYPPATDISCSVALLVGELAANAVCHGRVPGRDFQLRLSCDPGTPTVRIEVSDAKPQQPRARPVAPSADDESGRGLLLVDILAIRWGSFRRHPIGKTVWAEVEAEQPHLWTR
jgi:anti-sigma regulatory factor (Ser/Thr protein kinase)